MEIEGVPEDHPLREVIEHVVKHQMDDAFWSSEFNRRLDELTTKLPMQSKTIGRLLTSELFDNIINVSNRNVLTHDEIVQAVMYIACELYTWAQLMRERKKAPSVDGDKK